MIVHIGYHKTGTTYLQSRIFPHLEGVKYVDWQEDNTIGRAFFSSPIDVDWKAIKEHVQNWGEGPILHSSEQYVGPLFFFTGINKTEIAHQLKELGTTKVIITVRNQIKLIDSCYRQYIQEGGTLKYHTFWKSWAYAPNPLHFDFYRLVKYYVDLYGKENVLVIPNEWLRNNEEQVISKIEDFTGGTYRASGQKAKPNSSISNFGLSVLRITNMFTYSAHKPSTFLLPKRMTTWKMRTLFVNFLDPLLFRRFSSNKSYVSSQEAEQYTTLYREGNKALSEFIGVDLGELGYPV